MVTARLRAIDDQSTADLVAGEEEGDRRWALTREQRLTYMKRYRRTIRSLPENSGATQRSQR